MLHYQYFETVLSHRNLHPATLECIKHEDFSSLPTTITASWHSKDLSSFRDQVYTYNSNAP